MIAAIATAPGRGGIGVVRVSGAGVAAWFRPLLGRSPVPRSATYCSFFGGDGSVIDQGIVLYFPAPHSFTGEDVLELHGHGGPVVMRMLLRRCVELGARVAEAGEFSKRAFLNNKLDLAQAEGVADLIDAGSSTAARSALRSLTGEFSRCVRELGEALVELRVFVEAHFDFPEEELGEEGSREAVAAAGEIRRRISELRDRARRGSVLRNGIQVVLVGQPNVGKSSLLNLLAGEDCAIVTDIPGTTRDAVGEHIEIEGVPLHVVDTAGLRETTDVVEMAGIERTWREIGKCDAVLYLVDARCGIATEEEPILARLPRGVPRITVHNKADLTGDCGRRDNNADGRHVWLSAKSGQGLEALVGGILELAGVDHVGDDAFLGRERHLDALGRALGHLDAALEVALAGGEFFAEELRLAHGALGEITGKISADDLLGEIFSRFCIGK